MNLRHLVIALSLLGIACSSDGDGNPGSAGTSGSGGVGGAAGVGGSAGSGAGGSGGSAGSTGGSAGSAGCDVSQVAGTAVADVAVDLDAFPPYALDGCQLLYVSGITGDLLLRDLTSSSESLIAPAADSPRRPTLAGSTLAWEATKEGKSVVVVSAAGTTQTVTGSFDHAGEPRAASDAVVFTAWLTADANGDTDVYVFDIAGGSATLVGGGPKQQRFADISASHVAYTDLTEDPAGYYVGDGSSLADVVLVERATSAKTALPNLGKQAFPMLGGSGVLGFLEWVMVHPIPKLQEYSIKSVPLSNPGATPTEVAYVQSLTRVRPIARGDLFEWVVNWEGMRLYRAPVDGSVPATAVVVSAEVLHAPVANATTTVLAVRPTLGAAPELEAIPR